MKKWFTRKSRTLKEREVAALEEANRLEKERLRLKERQTRLGEEAIMRMAQGVKQKSDMDYLLPALPDGVVPKGRKSAIAMDSCAAIAAFANNAPQFYSGFIGYPALASMSQSSDYRCVPETTANEMTREWGKVRVKGDVDEDLSGRVQAIERRLDDLNVRDLIRRAIEVEGQFGRSQLYVDIKGQEGKTDLPLVINKNTIGKGDLRGFRLIEPMWSTPSQYNATDPLKDDFYTPKKWFVLGEEIHSDRLLTLITRPVPDMLKPAYNFSGISMYQLMQPYVERWQRTVDSVSDLIHSFSLTGLRTDMSNILEGGEDGMGQLLLRSQMFSALRNNQNMMLMDKDSEEFFQFNTPLNTLDVLLQKSQEQMAAPSHTPLVKLLGVTPSGLNANSDGEIRVYNDYISSLQEAHIRPIINVILELVQMDLFGDINDQVVFEFNPLEQMNDEQLATIDKSKADRDFIYVQAGVLSAADVRNRLANEDEGDYSGIDADDVPDMDFDLEHALTQEETNTFADYSA
ncbi:hypothetical protein AAEX37_01966 [Oligella sp. MSHR50489EDL]|uniref:DUF1073 domain-containing protein n=1 Tax=Oligella sp. MSHR50489EDL TaxID=3139409 RepID=UPI003D8170E9